MSWAIALIAKSGIFDYSSHARLDESVSIRKNVEIQNSGSRQVLSRFNMFVLSTRLLYT